MLGLEEECVIVLSFMQQQQQPMSMDDMMPSAAEAS